MRSKNESTSRRWLSLGLLSCVVSLAHAQDCDWSALTDPDGIDGVSHEVRDLIVFDDGSGEALYASGFFNAAGAQAVEGIARWDGTQWSPVLGSGGSGIDNDRVYAMAIYDDGSGPGLYAAGSFTGADGQTVNNIARWDGTDWSALTDAGGTGVDRFVNALTVWDDGSGPALYVGGAFFDAGGQSAAYIARWDGTDWSTLPGPVPGPLGIGMNNDVRTLTVHDDGSGEALYAGGIFTIAGGISANRVARWDGNEWSALTGPGATGVDNQVLAITSFDDGSGADLYAAGFFTTAGGQPANGVARWDGSAWSGLTAPGGTGLNPGGAAAGLMSFDDGSGPALYIGGLFSQAGGVDANSVARWDGTDFSPLEGAMGDGVSNFVNTFAAWDDGSGPALYTGGFFEQAGGVTANNIARWSCTQGDDCPADLTGDGMLNFFDLSAFLQAFNAQEPDGDFTGDGQHNFFDLSAYLQAFNAGCP